MMHGVPLRCFVALVLAAPASMGCDRTPSTAPVDPDEGPTVEILSPPNGAAIDGNVVVLEVEAEGIAIVPADGDTSGETGHFQVFINRDPVAPGEEIQTDIDVVESTETSITIPGLSTGMQTLRVVLTDGVNARIGSGIAEVTVTIEGPSVQATGPPTIPAGDGFELEMTVEGVEIVPADGNPREGAGHFHVFIDPETSADPPAIPITGSDPIDTADITVPIGALAAGVHTLWVVVVDGRHIPFDPPVMARVTVVAT